MDKARLNKLSNDELKKKGGRLVNKVLNQARGKKNLELLKVLGGATAAAGVGAGVAYKLKKMNEDEKEFPPPSKADKKKCRNSKAVSSAYKGNDFHEYCRQTYGDEHVAYFGLNKDAAVFDEKGVKGGNTCCKKLFQGTNREEYLADLNVKNMEAKSILLEDIEKLLADVHKFRKKVDNLINSKYKVSETQANFLDDLWMLYANSVGYHIAMLETCTDGDTNSASCIRLSQIKSISKQNRKQLEDMYSTADEYIEIIKSKSSFAAKVSSFLYNTAHEGLKILKTIAEHAKYFAMVLWRKRVLIIIGMNIISAAGATYNELSVNPSSRLVGVFFHRLCLVFTQNKAHFVILLTMISAKIMSAKEFINPFLTGSNISSVTKFVGGAASSVAKGGVVGLFKSLLYQFLSSKTFWDVAMAPEIAGTIKTLGMTTIGTFILKILGKIADTSEKTKTIFFSTVFSGFAWLFFSYIHLVCDVAVNDVVIYSTWRTTLDTIKEGINNIIDMILGEQPEIEDVGDSNKVSKLAGRILKGSDDFFDLIGFGPNEVSIISGFFAGHLSNYLDYGSLPSFENKTPEEQISILKESVTLTKTDIEKEQEEQRMRMDSGAAVYYASNDKEFQKGREKLEEKLKEIKEK